MDAVTAHGVFTPSEPLVWKHFLASSTLSVSANSQFPIPVGKSVDAPHKAAEVLLHDKMIAAAKASPPPRRGSKRISVKLRKPTI